MIKTGVRIKTHQIAGRYQHACSDTYAGAKRPLNDSVDEIRIPEEVVGMLRLASERMYELMPDGSKDLEVRLNYKRPNL